MAVFNDLPFEIRRLIWLATFQPQTVLLQFHFTPRQFTSNHPVPSIMHICHESRSLNLYEKLHGSNLNTGGPYIYINFDHDLIDIGYLSTVGEFTHFASRIRRLKFQGEHSIEFWFHGVANHLAVFDNLEMCIVVAGDGWQNWDGFYEQHYFSCARDNLHLIDEDCGRIATCPEIYAWAEQCDSFIFCSKRTNWKKNTREPGCGCHLLKFCT